MGSYISIGLVYQIKQRSEKSNLKIVEQELKNLTEYFFKQGWNSQKYKIQRG
ncbi:tRNA A37 threonylcarbamoyladenosine synthetase subunit TsaC/SUA5/YrdC [Methanococcus maripaludis]|uniref:tRNA A37 threonylcarbamoyladenosine synthetase subunit TsaC/SUA5/YrdC n=1 Tax=Methanococcus maripaludis TaxID=39152 RepID=A0A7J9S556_METMI|nr:tRNA A37 threonylcarbamoyladenosine synthetase subunit TsaC/SUA5/YrdC [Methanococcus maripaludis]